MSGTAIDAAAVAAAVRHRRGGLAENGQVIDEPLPPEPPPDGQSQPDEDVDRHALAGGDAILDTPDDVPALIGTGSDVLAAFGEPTMIAAPAGLGKTSLAQQFVLGFAGLRTEVLGLPVTTLERPILYLAMDRPRQILRSFRRMVTEADREILNDRLIIRTGPPPRDIAADTTVLTTMARRYGAGMVVIDSLKDAAVKLTDDEAGGNVNRAIQTLIANDIEVLVLHHQRKGQGGEKPKKLEDVYGSTWITAGMGSVILLWGAAGDSIVDLIHLKQPAEAVGPFKIEHDHVRGVSTIYRGFDLLPYLQNNAQRGVTVEQVAVAMFEKTSPTDNEKRKASRKLAAAVDRGIAYREEPERGGDGGTKPARYYLVERGLG